MKNDDYLWDRSGEPDEEVRHLEDLLSRYRYRGRRRRSLRLLLIAAPLAVAAAILVAVIVSRPDRPADDGPGWNVEWLAGGGTKRLVLGETLETGEGERVRIAVADIGRVDLEPKSRVRLTRTGKDEHRLALDVGELHAFVSAPPRLFVVETPVVAAVDLGCAYTLKVDDDGGGFLTVTSGAVQLEAKGRPASLVAMGATCRIVAGEGPGIPWYEDAPEELRDLDTSDISAVDAALAVARTDDILTLWHVLPRVDLEVRTRVYNRMVMLDPAPEGVSRQGILDLDEGQLTAWRNALDPWSNYYDD